ncbi:30S ribosomal protein S5 [Candidatus Woesearchaeota archaeon]|nr:30S ribosomal protein S5 [Candidatus Woesearchaeota archaeon]
MPKVKKKFPEKEKEGQETVPGKQKKRKKRQTRSRKGFNKEFDKDAWKPKTDLGKKVKSGEIDDVECILDNASNILEAEIIDTLVPNLDVELLLVGQSKGKFGGGSRRIFRQTQKKTREGNKPKFATIAAVGNKNGYIGLGYGKSKETVPAREKSIRNAKLNLFKIRRGCGSWQCGCKEPHTIPYKVEGKCGSVILKLFPAPKGTGLKIEDECGKILELAGIKDVWSKTLGKAGTKYNLIYACIKALKRLMTVRTKADDASILGIVEGKIKAEKEPSAEDFKEIIPEEEKSKKEETEKHTEEEKSEEKQKTKEKEENKDKKE